MTNTSDPPIPLSLDDIRQSWHRIQEAMEFYASCHIARLSFDANTGAMSNAEVGYLASNCMPDVKRVEAFFRQHFGEKP